MATSSVVSAVQWIGSLLIQEARPLLNVEEQVQGLKDELEFMQQYLQDVDARQEEKEISVAVRKIRKLSYDAEDVIDTYVLKVSRSDENWLVRVLYKIPRIYLVREKIQVIQTSLKRVNDNLNSFGLRRDTELVGLKRGRPPSYPYDDGDGKFVVGLEEDFPKLLEVLTSEGNIHVNIMSIVGMGGSGKTTLARKLYNHPLISECFNCTAWVPVSQEWSTLQVLSEILREVRVPETTPVNLGSGSSSVPEFTSKLRNALKHKSYLIVLDDVWRREALDEILPALPLRNVHGGSKIIITTRNRDIVQFQNLHQNMYMYEPPPLNCEEGWELFRKIALNHNSRDTETSFENLGKEMLEKCDGLPLAIVALAGILNMKDSIAEWQKVSEAVRSRVMDGTDTHMYGRVGDILALSYNDLPYYLKPCFLYLSLFPEDFKIPVGMLTRMWIAEGLVSEPPEDMSIEDFVMQHLEELSHRYLIKVVRTNFKGVIKSISLHDLLRDVCVKKAKEMSFLQIDVPTSELGRSDTSAFSVQPRRVAIHSSTSLPPEIEISYLRSLVLLHTPMSTHLDLMFVPQRYKLLRLLTLRGIRTLNGSLPSEIGSLIHLRYLEIRSTNITELPISIGKLSHLLVLDYRDVVSEYKIPSIKIPNVLWKLVLLRHLFLPIDCPWSMGELKLSTIPSLQTLWGVKQDQADSQWLSREISELSNSVKKLKIVVSSEYELKAAFSNPSLKSDGLQTFYCELKSGMTLRNVEPLCHLRRLHKLILIGHVETKLLLILPTNLVSLNLKDSELKDEDLMAVLGALNHLKLLKLFNAFAGTELRCKSRLFPQLEELYLENLTCLQVWKIDEGAMPRLKKLEIKRCWRLGQFPKSLEFVTTLQQCGFDEMPFSFIQEATKYGWSPLKLRLPSNYGVIIQRSDSPVDTSSIRKLHEQLTAGILLDNKKQKYWIVELHNVYINCFMLYASNLLWDDNKRRFPRQTKRKDMESEDGTPVIAFDGTVTVFGKFNTADLSFSVTYEVVWVVMWERLRGGILMPEDCYSVTGFSRHGEKLESSEVSQEIDLGSLNKWVQVRGGEFETMPPVKYGNEEIQISLRVESGFCGVKVKGFIIQPRGGFRLGLPGAAHLCVAAQW